MQRLVPELITVCTDSNKWRFDCPHSDFLKWHKEAFMLWALFPEVLPPLPHPQMLFWEQSGSKATKMSWQCVAIPGSTGFWRWDFQEKKIKFNSVLFLTFGVFLNSQINSKQQGKACLWFSINSLKKIFLKLQTFLLGYLRQRTTN